MTDEQLVALRDRLHLLACGFARPNGPSGEDAVRLAEDLIVAGLDGPATVEVAVLRRDTTLRDSEHLIRAMLSEHGIAVTSPENDEEEHALLLTAFGFWGLPIHAFEGPFYARLPGWDEQEPLDHTLVVLLHERDQEADPRSRSEVEARMRIAVRAAATTHGTGPGVDGANEGSA
jgi:hypothetical protein